MQDHYEHHVPKTAKKVGARINLTFRIPESAKPVYFAGTRQKEWVLEHPKAAKASRALLRAVERWGKDQPGGENAELAALIKRKQGLLKKTRRHPI